MFTKALSFIIFIAISINSYSQHSNENYSLLWEVTGNNIKEKSYIFGSIHRNNKILFSFPDSLYHALYSSETLAIEADLFSILLFSWKEEISEANFLFTVSNHKIGICM